jgi:predicted aspartyl protease
MRFEARVSARRPRRRGWTSAAPASWALRALGCILVCAVMALPALALAARASLPATGPAAAAPTRRDREGRIVAPVMIDGKGPFQFLVDTGANSSMVTPALVRALGLVALKTAAERVEGITGAERLPCAAIESLRIGNIVKHDLRLPISGSPVLDGLDGILGLAGFGAGRVLVDFHENKVIIDRSRAPFPLGFLAIRARHTPGGLLVIPARVGGVAVAAVIDTGAAVTLGNGALRKALMRDAAGKHSKARILGVTWQTSAGSISASPVIHLGPAAIENLVIVYSDTPIFKVWNLDSRPALIIGMNVLSAVEALALDYARARVYLLPADSGQPSVQISDLYVSGSLGRAGSD